MTTVESRAAEWGTAQEMSGVEAIFWRAEVDPRLRSGGVVLDVLDQTPDWDRLVAAHEWAVRLVPRLHQRVVDDPLHIGPPSWIAAEVELPHHLQRVTVAADAGFDQVLDIATALHVEAFDPARPLWRAVLVDGFADGSSVYLFKVHHSMTDGQGTVQLFDFLHSDRRASKAGKLAPPTVPADPTTGADISTQRAIGLAMNSPSQVARLATGLGKIGARVVAHPQALGSALAYTRSLGRVSSPASCTPSPLLRNRGLDRDLRTIDVPLESLRAAGRAAGGSVNDAFLAGVLGGLRRYHHAHGVEVGNLPIALPVSLRVNGDDLGGNRFAGATIAGPAGEMDPGERMRAIHARVEEVRSEPALDFMGATAGIASRLPNRVLAKVALRLSSAIDVQASNIPGLKRPAYLAGARIKQMYVFGPVPGSAVMVTLLSHEGTCCIGVTTDRSAVPDPDQFAADLSAGIDEVVAFAALVDSP